MDARRRHPRRNIGGMIATRLPAVRSWRPLRLWLPRRLRAAWPALAWGCSWFAGGLALGVLTDVVVRIVA